MAKVALNFEDGITRFIETNPYESIADAAYREGINIPLDCADGACGTCKCLSKSGTFDPGDYIEEALTDEEAEQGYGLACQMIPESDMVVDILASSAACKVEATAYATEITALTFLSTEIVKLNVKITDGRHITFLPGQYANILVPGSTETRSYSFSSLSDADEMEFIIRLLPQGLMSDYLRKAQVGDALEITGPLGSFYSRAVSRPTLFFAGGTGIAPFIAMLEQLETETCQQQIQLYYGATTTENVVELDRINAYKNIKVQPSACVSNEESSQYATGFVTQWITKEQLTESNYDVYICGPNAMVDAVKAALDEQQITYDNFYTEKFIPTGATA